MKDYEVNYVHQESKTIPDANYMFETAIMPAHLPRHESPPTHKDVLPSEYIKKEDAINKFKGMVPSVTRSYIVDAINAIPAEYVEPVVRGEWKEFDADMNAYSCSACNEPQMFIEGNPEQNEYSFCPHCGAHMERSGSGE